MYKSTLGFYGGVGNVTGANFMLDTGKIAVLIDCGLIQGKGPSANENDKPFPYDPKDIDFLIVTHAHTDHIGRIPKLVKEGFSGVIYSTPPTRTLAEVMLQDAFKIMQIEHEIYETSLWYDECDLEKTFSLWQTYDYYEWNSLGDDLELRFTNAGHILGSAIVTLKRGNRTLVCTGDLGNVPQPLMSPPDIPNKCNYMIIESVYGDRIHEGVEERTAKLHFYIERTREERGVLIIPAFSLERTQSMLYEINNLVESGEIDPIPVFLDSPLAIKVTDIYRNYISYLNKEAQDRLKKDDDLFSFPGFKATFSADESKTISNVDGPKIIIAGSGMSHGGRIRAHEQSLLTLSNTTLLLVGHQVVGSIGRRLQDGAKTVTIDGLEVKVGAKIETIRGFSGHADRDQLIDFVYNVEEEIEHVFVTMGEEKSSLFLTQRIHDYLGLKVSAPEVNQEYVIDF